MTIDCLDAGHPDRQHRHPRMAVAALLLAPGRRDDRATPHGDRRRRPPWPRRRRRSDKAETAFRRRSRATRAGFGQGARRDPGRPPTRRPTRPAPRAWPRPRRRAATLASEAAKAVHRTGHAPTRRPPGATRANQPCGRHRRPPWPRAWLTGHGGRAPTFLDWIAQGEHTHPAGHGAASKPPRRRASALEGGHRRHRSMAQADQDRYRDPDRRGIRNAHPRRSSSTSRPRAHRRPRAARPAFHRRAIVGGLISAASWRT